MGDDKLAKLDAFIGEWSVEMVAPWAQQSDVRGRTTFTWLLGRRYLEERSEVPIPEAPDNMAIVAPAAEGDGFTQHYFDDRGVVRLYAMTFDGEEWTLLRAAADFSPLSFYQRFVGRFTDGGNTIRGRWETSDDGAAWELDFELIYTRV